LGADWLSAREIASDEEEKLLYGLFLNSGMCDAEMQNTEYADFNWEKCTLHVQPKPWRQFRLKGKKKKKSAKDRFIPIPAKLVWKIKDRMRERNASGGLKRHDQFGGANNWRAIPSAKPEQDRRLRHAQPAVPTRGVPATA